MFPLCALLVAASVLAPATSIHVFGKSSPHSTHYESVAAFSFSDFVKKFNRTYELGSDEWANREALYLERKEEVLAFLSGPPHSWTKGITEFADYTRSEIKATLGYKGRRNAKTSEGAALFKRRTWTHPPEFSIGGEHRKLTNIVRTQGGCGSCWAHAATYVLEGHMESNMTLMQHMRQDLDNRGLRNNDGALSVIAATHCTPNPRKCGGEGGCSGATVELAYDMVQEKGMPLEVDWQSCEFPKVSLGITGYEVLPSNKLEPLMQSLYESGGPIAVAVAASGWHMYAGGIFDNCRWMVNHAVTLMGYKKPQGQGELQQGYWHIKNSWGYNWGESGFIRLEMKENEQEHCGMDKDAHAGIACEGDPDEAWVCGTCGVLYDSVYPTGLHLM